MFRLLKLRCPHLGVQPFGRFLFDFQGLPIKTHLYQQLSISFDVYIQVLDCVRQKVLQAVNRDAPDWRIKNACASCTYQLKGEAKMHFLMLVAYDGNDSAKRVLCQRGAQGDWVGDVTERDDSRVGGGDYFLHREAVDKWSKESMADMLQPVGLLFHRIRQLTLVF